MKIYSIIDKLIAYAKAYLELAERDEIYAKNSIFDLLDLKSYDGSSEEISESSLEELLSALVSESVKEGKIEEGDGEHLKDKVMGILSLRPSDVERRFSEEYAKGADKATKWLYDYSVANDYVKKAKLDANPRFDGAGGLIITINKAKPEYRDAKKAASGNSTAGGYPKCSICRENEGFHGRTKYTLRTVSLKLGGEDWFWQYSPYGYFYQHGIAVNTKHIPMHVDKGTFIRLMEFVDKFPHYFIGCNAALPRIGGSVLAHDHYQGGGEVLPLHKAGIAVKLSHPKFPDVQIGVLDWYGTAIRLSSQSKAAITDLAELIRIEWENYRNDEQGIIPFDEDGKHNAISPTAIKKGGGYEMTIILRSNITSKEFPDGVFHAHPEYHVIKKESVGLIEAQGLFILPGRLEGELKTVKELIENNQPLPEDMSAFEIIYDGIKKRLGEGKTKDIDSATRDVLSEMCQNILKNTAVFKTTEETVEFMERLGCKR